LWQQAFERAVAKRQLLSSLNLDASPVAAVKTGRFQAVFCMNVAFGSHSAQPGTGGRRDSNQGMAGFFSLGLWRIRRSATSLVCVSFRACWSGD